MSTALQQALRSMITDGIITREKAAMLLPIFDECVAESMHSTLQNVHGADNSARIEVNILFSYRNYLPPFNKKN